MEIALGSFNVQISVFPMTPAPHHVTLSSRILAASSVDLRPASVQILPGYSECLHSLQFLQFILPLRVQEASLLKRYLNALLVALLGSSLFQDVGSLLLRFFSIPHELPRCTLGQLPP